KDLKNIDAAIINSENCDRLPNTTNVSFENIDGTNLLRKLNNLAISRGSACSSNILKASQVLKAMGISEDLALSSFRISLGRDTKIEDINIAVKEISETI